MRNFLEIDEKVPKSCKNTPKRGKIPTFYNIFIFWCYVNILKTPQKWVFLQLLEKDGLHNDVTQGRKHPKSGIFATFGNKTIFTICVHTVKNAEIAILCKQQYVK